MTKMIDEFIDRAKGLATQFRRVTTNELIGTPWLFWTVMVFSGIGVVTVLRWAL